MKYEIIMRVQDNRYSDKVDKYRCVVGQNRYLYVIQEYEEKAQCIVNDIHPFGCWVLCNELDDNGEFVRVIQ